MALNLINSTTPTGTISAADAATDAQAIESWASARESEIAALEAEKIQAYVTLRIVGATQTKDYVRIPGSGETWDVVAYGYYITDGGTADSSFTVKEFTTLSSGAPTGLADIISSTTITAPASDGDDVTGGTTISNESVTGGDILELEITKGTGAMSGAGDVFTVTLELERTI